MSTPARVDPTVSTAVDPRLAEQIRPPCEVTVHVPGVRSGKCDQHAAWIVRTSCHCGRLHIALVCTLHYELLLTAPPGLIAYRCAGCQCTVTIVEFTGELL